MLNNVKIENNHFKNAHIKSPACHYFYDVIRLDSFDFDNILIDKKS